MDQKIVESWFNAIGATSEDGGFSIDKAKEVSLLLTIGEDIVPIARVDRVVFHDGYVEIRGEREKLFAPAGSITALKIGNEGTASETRTGFH